MARVLDFMTGRRLPDEQRTPRRYDGPADFLAPDGAHALARCEARYRYERWQGVITLNGFERGIEQGDVCRLTAAAFGELRIVITERVGSRRFEFIGLVKPDPLETL